MIEKWFKVEKYLLLITIYSFVQLCLSIVGKLVHLVKNLLKMTEEAVVLKKEECEFYIGVIPLKGRTKIFYGWNSGIKSGESGKYTFTIGKVCMMNGKK